MLLSLYLAIYPALAAGLAWRFGRDDRVVHGHRARRRLGDHRMAARHDVHRLPVEPAAAALAPTPLITITPLIGTYGLSALVVLLGGAIWLEYYSKWLPLVRDPRRHRLAVAAAVLAGARPIR